MPSGAYEASIERTGEGYVGSALNESAAIGEEGDGVGWTLEAKKEVVEADVAMGSEAVAHGGEIYGAMVLVDLDGVAAAEGDVRTAFSGEVGEDAVTADGAFGIGRGSVYFAAGTGPEIEREQGAAYEVGLTGEQLEGFGDLDGGGEIDGGAEDACRVAGLDGAGWGLGEDAGEAGSRFWFDWYVASLRL